MNLNYRCSSSKCSSERRPILLRVLHVKAVRCWPSHIINTDFHPPTFTSDEVKVLRHRLKAETKHLLLLSWCWTVNLDAALGAAWPSSRSTSPLGTAWVSLLTNTSTPQTQRRRPLICTVEPKLSHKALVWRSPSVHALGGHAPSTAALVLIHPVLLSPCPECDFEESHLCGYSNQWNANVNWFVGGGGTQRLRNNIPDDHTYNNRTGEKCNGMKEGVRGVCVCTVCLYGIFSQWQLDQYCSYTNKHQEVMCYNVAPML